MKTSWPAEAKPADQIRTVTNALARLGPENISGLVVFARYTAPDEKGREQVNNAIFTAGAEVDIAYDWAAMELAELSTGSVEESPDFDGGAAANALAAKGFVRKDQC